MKVLPGKPYPLGATFDGIGVNFSLYSEHASGVDLCLFDSRSPDTEYRRIPLNRGNAHVWHVFVGGVRPGQIYGYRVEGPYDPSEGHRFNPSKLLIDPYAKALAGRVDWKAPVFGYELMHASTDLSYDARDSAAGVPKGVVVDTTFDWDGDRLLQTPWNETVIYETHVKGLSMRHPGVPEDDRGTYAGVASRAIIEHLQSLGVTAVELLPVHSFLDDSYLEEKGLKNYWGYNTINFFSPDSRYSGMGDTGGQVAEFKAMVKALHKAGIEVILDVVYNHTAEGNHLGPTLSLKGIDNCSYYRVVESDPRYYMDYTGTGNTLNARSPQVLKMIMDSLRYWVTEMHVDGFRFDLASALARELHDVDRLGSFFDIIQQDPIISTVKLIAEPWDIGEGGYQVGNFPPLWAEWNGKYRDTVRAYWKGDGGTMKELGYRLTGSSDLYQGGGRNPYASINFVTAHDGFTLHDLVSYNEKHNHANGEENRDGSNDNASWNHGEEGPTRDPEIIALRERQKRNMLTTLLLSQGVPMISGGDELGRTQGGNNNAYAQDNEISWYDWDLGEQESSMLEFTKRVLALRRAHPGLRRSSFFQGQPIHGSDVSDITWIGPDGAEMRGEEWDAGWNRTVGMRLGGEALREVDANGEPVTDDTLLVLLNAHHDDVAFTLPSSGVADSWEVLLDTFRPTTQPPERMFAAGEAFGLGGRSMALFRRIEASASPGRATVA